MTTTDPNLPCHPDFEITDLDRYQIHAWDLVLPQCRNLTYLSLGLGEAGEVQGKVKKVLRGDYNRKDVTAPEFRYDIKKELGDLLFYVAGMAKVLGLDLSDIATSNIVKLHDRKARGVLQGSGDNR